MEKQKREIFHRFKILVGGEGFPSYQGMNYHLMGMPPGSSEFNGFPNNNGYPYAPQIPDQFNAGFKNFAMGQPASQMPPDFSGPQGNGQFMPQQRMPRQSKLSYFSLSKSVEIEKYTFHNFSQRNLQFIFSPN